MIFYLIIFISHKIKFSIIFDRIFKIFHMKKSFFYIVAILFIFSSCSSSKAYIDPQKTQELLSSGNFSFQAEKANPTNMDVINVMNSMPYNNSARILTLDPGYSVDFKTDEIVSQLPYFGRMFVANMDPQKNGYNFTSKSFTIDKSKSSDKKTVWIVNFNDLPQVRQIFLEIYKNGRAYLSINSNDRQAISYDGYISEKK